MRKMGFEGRLGKDGQGISNPIATKVFIKLNYNHFCRKDRKVQVWEQTDSKKHQRLKQIEKSLKYIIKYVAYTLSKQNAGITTEEEEKKKEKKKNWWKDSDDEEESTDENGTAEENSEDYLSATDSEDRTPRRKREKKMQLQCFDFEIDLRRLSNCQKSRKSSANPANPNLQWYSQITPGEKQN